jgi:Cys-rich protein (TIGR01571 family)
MDQTEPVHQGEPGVNTPEHVRLINTRNGDSFPTVVTGVDADLRNEWTTILTLGLCRMLDDTPTCLLAACCTCCLAGQTAAKIGNGTCIFNCVTYPCQAGCQRRAIQETLGVKPESWLLGMLLHQYCSFCAVASEARAVNAWVKAGRPRGAVAPPEMISL